MNDVNRPLWQWSACDLAGATTRGDVSATEAVRSVLDRMHATNDVINAVVDDLSEAAIERAAGLDRRFDVQGPAGPLHGVPVTIKVNVDQEGRATTNGVTAFKDVIAPADAPVVRNLLKAGAIVIGRTNTPEFSFRATTVNDLYGATVNPWNHEMSSGGSSGGASAAALMGYAPINHGNDIGGSLRFPAFACGLSTVRPTLGRVPAYNPSAPEERPLLAQLMSVQGAICREVRDVRLAMRSMVAPDPRDPWHVPVPCDGQALSRPIKVAVTRQPLGYDIHPAIVDAVDRAADMLARAGYAVEAVDPPATREVAEAWIHNTYGEMELMMGEGIRAHGSDIIKRMFDDYYALEGISSPEELVRGMSDRTRLLRNWLLFLEDWPLVLTPFMMRPLYRLNEDAEGRAQLHDIFRASYYSFAMNYLGLPAAIAPTGLYEGLPVGVQLVSRRFREDLCLDAAQAIEAETGVMAQHYWAVERERGEDGKWHA